MGLESRFGVMDAHTNQYLTGVTMQEPMTDVDTMPKHTFRAVEKAWALRGGGVVTDLDLKPVHQLEGLGQLFSTS